MKQKEWIAVIVAMVIVAVIVSILTFVVMQKAQPSLSPYWPPGTPIETVLAGLKNAGTTNVPADGLAYLMEEYYYPKNQNGDMVIPGSINFPINTAFKGNVKLSATGFEQTYAESENSKGSIWIGGDDISMSQQGTGWERKMILSPGSISLGEKGGDSSLLSGEYLQFCNNVGCIYCYPDIANKVLSCK